MINNNKLDFMNGLRAALVKYGVADSRDILIDFEQHFADGAAMGESESEVCQKLGDVDEIAKQYVSDADVTPLNKPMTEAENFASENSIPFAEDNPPAAPVQPTQSTGFTPDSGKIVGVICMDIFLYSWAIPALIGLVISLVGIGVGFAGSGIGCIAYGAFSHLFDFTGIIATGFAPISCIFLGIMLIALGGMIIIGFIGSIKGMINLIKRIINQHSRAFVGHNVVTIRKGGKK